MKPQGSCHHFLSLSETDISVNSSDPVQMMGQAARRALERGPGSSLLCQGSLILFSQPIIR